MYLLHIGYLGLEKILFVSCNVPERNRVGRSVKKELIIFGSKMCVLCMFYDDLELGGRKNFRLGIFFNINLLG